MSQGGNSVVGFPICLFVLVSRKCWFSLSLHVNKPLSGVLFKAFPGYLIPKYRALVVYTLQTKFRFTAL